MPEEVLPETVGDAILRRLLTGVADERIAEQFLRTRRAHEAVEQRRHPGEGLRERKRRLTRQLISDAATVLFSTRGFDNVKVSEVAELVGVSEKTIYNYFPTKESMVLDQADEGIERVAAALRNRPAGESITQSVVRALRADLERLLAVPDDVVVFIPAFRRMVDGTPALRAAMLELHDRLAEAARDELARTAGVDPAAPEPTIAGRALAGLSEIVFEATNRHIDEGLRGDALRLAIEADLERAARLLEAGLWSFNVLARGGRTKQQAIEAARAAEEARVQVVRALRQARAAWSQLRRERAH